MNNKRNRAAVKIRLMEIATVGLTEVDLYDGLTVDNVEVYADRTETIPVRHTWDGGAVISSAMFLGQAEGQSEAQSVGTQASTDDRWGVSCQIIIVDCPDGQTAELAAEAALNAFDAVLRRCTRLVDPEGDVDAGTPPTGTTYDVASARITDVVGPYHTFARPAGTGQISGVVDFTVAVVTNIR